MDNATLEMPVKENVTITQLKGPESLKMAAGSKDRTVSGAAGSKEGNVLEKPSVQKRDVSKPKPAPKAKPKSNPYDTMPKSKHIAVDTEACGGCLTCEMACSGRHFNGDCNSYLSAIRIDADMLDYNFDFSVCKQCKTASCVAACRMGAMNFDEKTGARYIDKEKCIACGACVKACPFAKTKIPVIRREVVEGRKRIIKCDLCHGYEDGPLCIQVCPKSAIHLEA